MGCSITCALNGKLNAAIAAIDKNVFIEITYFLVRISMYWLSGICSFSAIR